MLRSGCGREGGGPYGMWVRHTGTGITAASAVGLLLR